MNQPAIFIRIESAAILIGAILSYISLDFNGWLLLLLFFTPDVSLFAYLFNPRVGALSYNLIHNFFFPVIGITIGILIHTDLLLAYCMIWTAHVGFDRVIGFGLMKPDRFGDSNLADIDLRTLIARRK